MVHSHTHTYSYTKSFVFRHSWSLTRRLEKLDLIILTEIVTVCIEWRLLRLKNMGSVKIVHTYSIPQQIRLLFDSSVQVLRVRMYYMDGPYLHNDMQLINYLRWTRYLSHFWLESSASPS